MRAQPRASLLLAVVAATALWPALVSAQSSIGVAGVSSEAGWHVLLSVPEAIGGEAIVAVEIDVAGGASVGHVPGGWADQAQGQGLRLDGPPLGPEDGRFRLDLPTGEYWPGAIVRLMGAGGELLYERVPPPADYPDLEVAEDSADFLLAPEQAAAGEVVRLEVKAEELIGRGEWRVGGLPARSADDSPFLHAQLSPALQPGQFASIRYTDQFGLETISDAEGIRIVGAGTEGETDPPSLTGCTPRVFRGRTACVCGTFPTDGEWGTLYLDGRPLGGPRAGSSRVVHVLIPGDVSPGVHVITADGMQGSVEILVLASRGEIDFQVIESGGSTPLRVVVEGTAEPLPLVLRNLSPDVISLEGGVEQVVETSGGSPNRFERTATGLSPGAFNVYYGLAEDPCPCLDTEVLVAEGPPIGPTRTRKPPDSTRPRPPWWPESDDRDDPRDLPPPTIYGEELDDDEEDPPCCGLRGPLLVWPQTTDPLAPGAPVAPHHPAVGGVQVLLPSGAYFHNERDLFSDAVGIPFDLTRHFTSDVETLSGGSMGHRWDFSLNKRLVALGRDFAGGLRGQLLEIEDSVVMVFDGQGRALRYVEQGSDWRRVLNFGAAVPFRAYVTTYLSPEGEFNELQRYVLEDAAQHPFAEHPDVDAANSEAIFYVLRERNGIRYVFNCRGQLLHILARNDYASLPAAASREPVRFTFRYQGPLNPLTQNNLLSSIEDPSGRRYGVSPVDIDQGLVNTNVKCVHINGTFPIPRIKKISGAGVEIEYVYAGGDSSPVLEAVRFTHDDLRTETRYRYDGEHRLTAVVAPEAAAGGGGPYIEVTYDGEGRVAEQRLGGEPRATFAYGGEVTVTDPTGGRTTYALAEVGGYPVVRQQTAEGPGGRWTTRYDHNDASQITAITLPRGNRIAFEYDPSNGPVTLGPMRNDLDAGVTYHNDLSRGNLVAVRREVGSLPRGDGPEYLVTRTDFEPLYNQPSRLADARGNQTIYEFGYDEQGDLGNPLEEKRPDLTQPDGSVAVTPPRRFAYNARGQLEAEANGSDAETSYSYGEFGYLTAVNGPGLSRTYARDLYGRLLSETGPEGEVRYEHDGRGLVVREVHDPYGFANETRYRYDRNGNLLETRVEVKDNFRGGDRLVAGIDAPATQRPGARSTTVAVDILGRPVREEVSGAGVSYVVSRAYDVLGRVLSTEEPSPAGGAVATSYDYDARGAVIREARAGRETRHAYDPNGNLIRTEIGPVGATRTYGFEYDAFDRLVATVSPAGTTTRRVLDASGNVIREEVHGDGGDVGGGSVILARSEQTFNELDLVTRVVGHVLDEAGTTHTTTYAYTPLGEIERIETPGGAVTRFSYDAAGRLAASVDAVGNRVERTYDGKGRLTEQVEIEAEWAFDPASRQWQNAQREYRTTMSYDALGRLASVSGGGTEAGYRHDSMGKERLRAVQHVGRTETQYDGLGRPVRIDAGGVVQTMTYTPAGQLAELVAPHVHQRWRFDAHGLEIESTDVLGRATTRIERDAAGNPVTVTDANGTRVQRVFDALGFPTRETVVYGQVSVQAGGQTFPAVGGAFSVVRRYDGLGRLRYAEAGAGTYGRGASTSFVYDGLGRIVRETQALGDYGQTLERRYAPDDAWSETRLPELAGAAVVRQHLDALGRTVRVDLDGEMVASYLYSGTDRVAGRSLRNGTLSEYSYDAQRRLTGAREWAEMGPAHGQPEILWTARASYTDAGRLAGMIWTDAAKGTVSETGLRYDRRGRMTESTTTTGTAAGQTVSRLLTTYDGDRPGVQAEILVDTFGERPVPVFARVQRFEYDGARVAAVATTARNRFSGTMPDLASTDDVASWISGSGSHFNRQAFAYDPAGNLVADEANVYTYDWERRLTRVAQIPANRPYNQAVVFRYDALGRRVHAYPTRDRVPSGLVEFAPWERDPVWFYYDGPYAVAEVVHDPENPGLPGSLLARYLLGARPGEKVRMDRRIGDDPAGRFAPYYLHSGLQAQVAFLTDGDGRPHHAVYGSSERAGSAAAPPDDHLLIEGTRTRSPYLGWTLRTDGFSGVKHDEVTGRPVYDYRSTERLGALMDMAAYRESITTAQNRGAIALGVMTMAAIAPVGAAFEGLLTVGLNWYAASTTQSPYTLEEAGEHFAQGVLSGGLGKLIPGGTGMLSRYAADYATDFAAGMAMDVAWRDRSWGDAVGDNLIGAAASASIGTGVRLGVAGVGVGFRGARMAWRMARLAAQPPGSSPPAFASSLASSSGSNSAGSQRLVTGGVFDTALRGRFRSTSDLHFQVEMLDLLNSGTFYHRFIARLIVSGRLTVHWDANLPANTMGQWGANNGTAIYLNPWAFRQHPSGALAAASVVVHEATHALGGGEPVAHIAQGQFLHHWRVLHNRKYASATGPGGSPARYVLGPHYDRLIQAYQAYRLTSNVRHVLHEMYLNGYRVAGPYFIKPQWVNHLHTYILRAGGWQGVLNLDPATVRVLEHHLTQQGGFSY